MEKIKFKSPYLPNRVADGVSVPLPKPDYDFEGAVSGFDYNDPNIYPSSPDPDFTGGYGASAEGIYDTQYSLGGNILDRLLDEQADTIEPSSVTDSTKLKEELEQAKKTSRVQTNPTTKTGMYVLTPIVAIIIAFALGFFLSKITS